eukprot:Plantae.Rhodophyta-Purpureofilum_apyrenoidigerum.ctg13995.p1 GENE.Plantae.Rhodophyta-Purpureofilum_apyrenoidigerum.ctg13995~~Plantae.Rhodophyta-Purpureofilum_apyrenoidigerum.ctg13995.p1  ORF type:complete len:222 (-),score=33.80 Plantae.Rhodophyta-Purpureofilum_apyrenoidigerum.ctg13995:289-954(-)
MEQSDAPFDAVIIPGGGLDETGAPHPFVKSRLRAALEVSPRPRWFITLSRGTTHRGPPLDVNGRPVDEATASAKFLVNGGIQPDCILQDTWSLDTIGNAYFSRFLLTDRLGLKNLLVVTSNFHMPRSKAIFDWIYGFQPTTATVSYLTVQDDDCMEPDVLQARKEKESKSLETFLINSRRMTTQESAAHFLFVEHGAYSTEQSVKQKVVTKPTTDPLLKSY